jgi:hypothetical protein
LISVVAVVVVVDVDVDVDTRMIPGEVVGS